MRFLTTSECDTRARQAGIRPDGAGPHRRKPARHLLQFSYQSRLATADAVAAILIASLGTYEWAVLWATSFPWGDRSLEPVPPLDWQLYAAWRLRHHEPRPLYDAPGHELGHDDASELARLIAFAIIMGWDARVFSHPLQCAIGLSHDDIITVRSHANMSNLAGRLIPLGLTLASAANSRRP